MSGVPCRSDLPGAIHSTGAVPIPEEKGLRSRPIRRQCLRKHTAFHAHAHRHPAPRPPDTAYLDTSGHFFGPAIAPRRIDRLNPRFRITESAVLDTFGHFFGSRHSTAQNCPARIRTSGHFLDTLHKVVPTPVHHMITARTRTRSESEQDFWTLFWTLLFSFQQAAWISVQKRPFGLLWTHLWTLLSFPTAIRVNACMEVSISATLDTSWTLCATPRE